MFKEYPSRDEGGHTGDSLELSLRVSSSKNVLCKRITDMDVQLNTSIYRLDQGVRWCNLHQRAESRKREKAKCMSQRDDKRWNSPLSRQIGIAGDRDNRHCLVKRTRYPIGKQGVRRPLGIRINLVYLYLRLREELGSRSQRTTLSPS